VVERQCEDEANGYKPLCLHTSTSPHHHHHHRSIKGTQRTHSSRPNGLCTQTGDMQVR